MHPSIHDEAHLSNRNHWLRAAVLGANDGMISTASLLVGVLAAGISVFINYLIDTVIVFYGYLPKALI